MKLANNRFSRTLVGATLIFTLASGHNPKKQNSVRDPFADRPALIDKSEEMIRAKLFNPLKALRAYNLAGIKSHEKETSILAEIAQAVREIEAQTNGDPLTRTIVRQNLASEQFAKLGKALNSQ